MAIIQNLTDEDIDWYRKQIEFVQDLFRDVVQKNEVLNPEVLEPKKPWEINCEANDMFFRYLDEIAHAINRIEAEGIATGRRATSTGSIEVWPPSMRRDRESRLAWDCLKPKIQWASSWAA